MSFSKLGSQFTVNTTTAADQFDSAVAQLENGNIVVVWTDENGSAVNVYGQLLSADGRTKIGGEFRVNTTLDNWQYEPSVTALANGGFAVGWTSLADWPVGADAPFYLSNSGVASHVVTQVFDADGDKVGSEQTHFVDDGEYGASAEFFALDTHYQYGSALTASLSGNGDDFDLYFGEELHEYSESYIAFPFVDIDVTGERNIAHFSATSEEFLIDPTRNQTWDDAHKFGLDNVMPSDYADLDSFSDIEAITLGDGTVVTAYTRASVSNGRNGVHIDIASEPGTVEVGGEDASNASLAELENGDIVVVWTNTASSADGDEDIKFQLLAPDGTKIGGETLISADAYHSPGDIHGPPAPDVAALADGRFMVVWENVDGDGDGSSLQGQIYTSAGDKSGEAFLINTTSTSDQMFPTVTGLANGDALVTWTDPNGGGDVFAQVIDPQNYSGDDDDETVHGGSLADTIYGLEGDDTLFGRDGDDYLGGGIGDDEMHGGDGDDTFMVGEAGDEVLEAEDNGDDTVQTSVDFTLPENVENLTGIALFNGLTLTGNGLDNTIHGSIADDTLVGLGGDDTLDGGIGDDRMEGGSGSDTYHVDSAGDDVVEDLLFEFPPQVDTVIASVDHTLTDHVENLTLAGDQNIDGTGNGGANEIHGNSGSNDLSGLDGGDRLHGEGGSDTLSGGEEGDVLFGGAEGDTLDGGAGADYMQGGSGDDVYSIDDKGDVVVEYAGEGDYDLIFSSISKALPANVEDLKLTGTANLFGTGNLLNNSILGTDGVNTLSGLAGDDHLLGFGGKDLLWGGAGADELDGGEGSDTVTYAGSAAVAIELGAQLFIGGDAAGDTSSSVENIIGSAFNDGIVGDGAANIINGGVGADNMGGAGGNDIFIVDNAGDTVNELTGEGIDTVLASVTYSILASGETENLALTGTAAINSTGNQFNNIFTGNGAGNQLSSGGGDDRLLGLGGGDRLIGGSGRDVMTGGEGDDIFDFNAATESGFGALRDRITDFSQVAGNTDRFDLAGIDADVDTAGDQAFAFLGAGPLTGAAQLRVLQSGNVTIIQGSTDADADAEFEIAVTGLVTFAATDFVL